MGGRREVEGVHLDIMHMGVTHPVWDTVMLNRMDVMRAITKVRILTGLTCCNGIERSSKWKAWLMRSVHYLYLSLLSRSVSDHHLRCGGWLNLEFSKREKHSGWAIKTIYKKYIRGMLKHIPLDQ